MNLVEQRVFNPTTDVMDEIPRTYYPGRGFLTDQEAYPTDLYGNPRPPTLEYNPATDGPPRIVPLPYLTPSRNQDNNPLKGGFDTGRALGAMAGYLGMGFGPAPRAAIFSPGPMLAGRYGDLLAKSPSFEIPGGESPYRYGPYLPFRGEEKKEEQMPFIPIPRKA